MSEDTYLVVPRVTTYSKQLAVTNPASGAVIALSDSPELIFTIRKEQNVDSVPLIKLTVGDGVTIDDQALGLCTVTLDPADTEPLTLGAYLWELRYVSGDLLVELTTNNGLLYLSSHLYGGVS